MPEGLRADVPVVDLNSAGSSASTRPSLELVRDHVTLPSDGLTAAPSTASAPPWDSASGRPPVKSRLSSTGRSAHAAGSRVRLSDLDTGNILCDTEIKGRAGKQHQKVVHIHNS